MTLAKCRDFIKTLQKDNLLSPVDIHTALEHYGHLDRRIGQLSIVYGHIQPEKINDILQYQTKSNGKPFGECAIESEEMSEEQIKQILRMQNDDLFLFAQSVIICKFMTMDKILGHLEKFKEANSIPPVAAVSAEEGAMKERIKYVKQTLNSINTIPPLPATATKAIQMLNDPDVDIEKLSNILTTDPSFVSVFLKMVNSAFYGLKSPAKNLKSAIMVVGIKKLEHVLLATAVQEKFKNVPADFANAFWEESIWAGEWAKELGRVSDYPEPDELFVSGLLQNIGQMVTIQHFPAAHKEIDKMVSAGTNILDAEKIHLGGTHADIGGYLFGHWKLPPDIVQSTMLHHHPVQTLLSMGNNVLPQTLIVNTSAAMTSIDFNLDEFTAVEQLEKIYSPYKALPLPGASNLNIERTYMRVSKAVENIIDIFSK